MKERKQGIGAEVVRCSPPPLTGELRSYAEEFQNQFEELGQKELARIKEWNIKLIVRRCEYCCMCQKFSRDFLAQRNSRSRRRSEARARAVRKRGDGFVKKNKSTMLEWRW